MSAAVHPRTEIRLMQAADLKAVAAVERAAYQFPWSLGIFRDCLLAGYHCLLLDVGGSVTGYGIMSIAAGEAHLLNLCVHPHAQRLGYGRKLLTYILELAEEEGAERVFLEVRPSNTTAQRLYRSVGFAQIGIRSAYYQADHGREDAIVLAITVPRQH